MSTRWALVTGTSTGIGRATVLQLVRQGVSVIAGVRRTVDADAIVKEAQAAALPGVRIVPVILDVASDASIAEAISQVTRLTGRDGLWALVNNAGIVVAGPVEHLSLAEWRRQFDVNFFGMAELTRLAIPLLRTGVTTHGRRVPRVVFVSSIGGRIAQPVIAPYTCSKFATTALGHSLRMELHDQGIGVTVLEPGAIATAIWAKGETNTKEFGPTHPARTHYTKAIDGISKASTKAASNAIPVDVAAAALLRSLLAKHAPAHVLVGPDAKIGALLRRFLPYSWFEAILRRQFGLT